MKIYNISTTAYEEEDFLVITDLPKSKILEVIEPLINAEREDLGDYDNESLVKELIKKYPTNFIELAEINYLEV